MDSSTREEEQPFGLCLGTFQLSATSLPEKERKSIEDLFVERGSEVDLGTALYPLSVHRRIERQWAERLQGQIVVGTTSTLPPGFNSVGFEIRVPVLRAIVDQLQPDQARPLD